MIPLISILLALGLPVYGLWRNQSDHPLKRTFLVSIGSFLAGAFAMIQEIITIKRRLFAGDIGGIADTIDAVLTICGVLLVLTVLLNWLLLGLTYSSGGLSGGTSDGTSDGTPDDKPQATVHSMADHTADRTTDGASVERPDTPSVSPTSGQSQA